MMKKLLCATAICGLLLSGTADAEIIFMEDFESGAGGFTVSGGTGAGLFHDGNQDYFTIVPLNGPANSVDTYTGFGGANFFAAEDIDDGNTRPGTQILNFNVNIAGFENLTFDGLFGAGDNQGTTLPDYDSNDGLIVRATIDGNPVQNLLAFEAIGPTNMELRQDLDFDGVGDLAGFLPTAALAALNGLAISGTGTNLLLEIEVASNDGQVEFAFDNLVINGDLTAVPEPSSFLLMGAAGAVCIFRRNRRKKVIVS